MDGWSNIEKLEEVGRLDGVLKCTRYIRSLSPRRSQPAEGRPGPCDDYDNYDNDYNDGDHYRSLRMMLVMTMLLIIKVC